MGRSSVHETVLAQTPAQAGERGVYIARRTVWAINLQLSNHRLRECVKVRIEEALIIPRIPAVERIVHKAYDFKSAAEWDIEQHVRMTPEERMRAARALRERAYPLDAKDVRACHETE